MFLLVYYYFCNINKSSARYEAPHRDIYIPSCHPLHALV